MPEGGVVAPAKGSSGTPRGPRTLARSIAIALGALIFLVALVGVVSAAVTTSSARVAATTDSEGFLSAGTVILGRDDRATLLFDAQNLYPGRVVGNCTVIRYEGSIAAAVRVAARLDGGSGLERYVDLVLQAAPGGTCDPAGSGAFVPLFDGRLSEFLDEHDSYDRAVELATDRQAGSVIAVRAAVSVVDDNRAAGRDTIVSFVFESRPS